MFHSLAFSFCWLCLHVCLNFLEVYYDNERDSRCFDHKFKFPNGYWIFWFLEKCCQVSICNFFCFDFYVNLWFVILYVHWFIHRFLSPLSVVPYVTFAGLGLYQLGFPMVKNWGLKNTTLLIFCFLTSLFMIWKLILQLAKCVEIGLPALIVMVFISQASSYFCGIANSMLQKVWMYKL